MAISRIVNAFFGWEFNSAEMLVAGDEVYPIDYANACPDVAVTSLHYYFPWAISALVRWSVYCLTTGRKAQVDLGTSHYFAIADDPDRTYADKLDAYLALADEHFETERYHDWCTTHLPHLDEQVYDWVTSDDFDRLLLETVRATYPPHEHDTVHGPLPRPARPVGTGQRALQGMRWNRLLNVSRATSCSASASSGNCRCSIGGGRFIPA